VASRDSLSLRDFPRYCSSKVTPDHSTISRTRRLLDLETHQAVFSWVLGCWTARDSFEARPSVWTARPWKQSGLKSIVRREHGRSYESPHRPGQDVGYQRRA